VGILELIRICHLSYFSINLINAILIEYSNYSIYILSTKFIFCQASCHGNCLSIFLTTLPRILPHSNHADVLDKLKKPRASGPLPVASPSRRAKRPPCPQRRCSGGLPPFPIFFILPIRSSTIFSSSGSPRAGLRVRCGFYRNSPCLQCRQMRGDPSPRACICRMPES
jgi:hypothetical protein